MLDAEQGGFLWSERLQEFFKRSVIFAGFEGFLNFLEDCQASLFRVVEVGRLRGIFADIVKLLRRGIWLQFSGFIVIAVGVAQFHGGPTLGIQAAWALLRHIDPIADTEGGTLAAVEFDFPTLAGIRMLPE